MDGVINFADTGISENMINRPSINHDSINQPIPSNGHVYENILIIQAQNYRLLSARGYGFIS